MRRCGCTFRPPLTRQIQQLEDELGALLFKRTSHDVELTDAGLVLYEEARHILGQAERAAERTHKAAQGLLGRIDVAIFGVIPQLLRRFRDAYPEVSIVLHSLDKDAQLDALRHPTPAQVDLCCIYRSDDDSCILQAFLGSVRQGVVEGSGSLRQR